MVAELRSNDPLRLGQYQIEGRLGEGGQGVVYLGRHIDGGEPRAIKLLHLEADDKARARFLREVEVAKKVAPFCTARLYDVGADGDQFYTVSEFVPGPSLQARVQQDGPLDEADLERLAVGTATALVSIHQAGIIHRDFKPHNVLLGPDGPRVIDFGVAKALSSSTTLTSRVIGTPSYMSPEQVEGEEVSTAADVFCWASTMVYAATGEPPFGQDTIMAVINRIANHEPELGNLQGSLRTLISACLAKNPHDRPSTRDVLMRLLGHADAPTPVVAPGDEPTAMLNAGAALAVQGDPNTTSLDPGRTTVQGLSPAQWAARGGELPAVPGVYPRREARQARRAAKVPWFITAAAVSFAVFTAGGAGFVIYRISSGSTAVPNTITTPSSTGLDTDREGRPIDTPKPSKPVDPGGQSGQGTGPSPTEATETPTTKPTKPTVKPSQTTDAPDDPDETTEPTTEPTDPVEPTPEPTDPVEPTATTTPDPGTAGGAGTTTTGRVRA